jgi:hypothetical protein
MRACFALCLCREQRARTYYEIDMPASVGLIAHRSLLCYTHIHTNIGIRAE